MTPGKLSMLDKKALSGLFKNDASELEAITIFEEILRLHEINSRAYVCDTFAAAFENEGLLSSAALCRAASVNVRNKA